MAKPEDEQLDHQQEPLPEAEANTNAADEGRSVNYMVSIGDQTYSVKARSAEEAGEKAQKLAKEKK